MAARSKTLVVVINSDVLRWKINYTSGSPEVRNLATRRRFTRAAILVAIVLSKPGPFSTSQIYHFFNALRTRLDTNGLLFHRLSTKFQRLFERAITPSDARQTGPPPDPLNRPKARRCPPTPCQTHPLNPAANALCSTFLGQGRLLVPECLEHSALPCFGVPETVT